MAEQKKQIQTFLLRLAAAALVILFLYAMRAARESGRFPGSRGTMAAVALGGLIILAWAAGDLFQWIGLPRMTGYMMTGLVTGPYMLKLISLESVHTLKFIDHVALTLIALRAGHEVRLSLLRRRLKGILSISFSLVILSMVAGFLLIFFGGRYFLPFLRDAPGRTVLLVALLFSVIEMAKSPVTTIAILDETRAEGPLAETTLGVVIVNDVILIVLFGLVMALGTRIANPGEVKAGFIKEVLWHLFGSLGAGALIGWLVSLALKWIQRWLFLLVIGFSLGLTLLCHALHLEILLVCLTAGFVMENFTRQGGRMLGGIEDVTPLVYLIFFPVASASLDLSVVRTSWVAAAVILTARKLIIYSSVRLGSRLANECEAVRKYGWMGYINQSGVTLVLAILIAEEFPEFGSHFKAIALAVIVITDVYAPAMFKYALYRAGEIPGERKRSRV